MKAVYHNDYRFKIVRHYLDKTVVEITPCGVTPPDLDEYPLYVHDNMDGDLEGWVKDNY